ncbi:PRKR-interacting protein 1 isoform X1 [Papio anubis]|uniref:PRKR-interacting protein 1 isoform X1 n=1 Tax=Papio anubis TaxID=9555 RepID=UPI000B7B7D5C|nr:PRKR-interacting protein 1 isoform X1 [Papio anubis]
MNIQQAASGSQPRLRPPLRRLRMRRRRATLSSYLRAAAAAARRGNWKAAMASSAASSVRPPRPKKEPQTLVIPKNAAEEQKLKLERLMKNPDKAVPIPEKMSEWAPRPPPEFVRDVMGSSAGAGSGEFHVYRHLRRREYQRQDYMDAMAEKQKLDAEFQKRLEKNKIAAEEQTAKRRKKRTRSAPGAGVQQLCRGVWNGGGGGGGAQFHHGAMTVFATATAWNPARAVTRKERWLFGSFFPARTR